MSRWQRNRRKLHGKTHVRSNTHTNVHLHSCRVCVCVPPPPFVRERLRARRNGVLRFNDHRGLSPSDIRVSASEFRSRFTRSKKKSLSKPVVVDSTCYVGEATQMIEGCKLLNRLTPHTRDYLITKPSTNLQGCTCSEMRFGTAYAPLNCLLAVLKARGEVLSEFPMTVFWTPHSGRASMPSCTRVFKA